MLNQILESCNVWIQNRSTNDDEPNVMKAANSSGTRNARKSSNVVRCSSLNKKHESIAFAINESRTSTSRSSKAIAPTLDVLPNFILIHQRVAGVRPRVSEMSTSTPQKNNLALRTEFSAQLYLVSQRLESRFLYMTILSYVKKGTFLQIKQRDVTIPIRSKR